MTGVAVAGLVVATDRPAAAGLSLGVAPGPDPAVEVRNGGPSAFSGTLVVEGRETPLRLAAGRSRTVPINLAGGCRGTAEVRLSGPGAPKGAVAVPCPTGATR